MWLRALASSLIATATAVQPRHTSTEFKRFGNVCLYRDSSFGVPLVLDCEISHPQSSNENEASTLADSFEAIGYAQAEDRLFQLFLRLSTANGRLSEFLGAGSGDINIESDKHNWRQMMTSEELRAQFSDVMDVDTQTIYSSFVKGMLQRVEEVNLSTINATENSLLPYEFAFYGLDKVPTNLFELESVLQYALSTMRRVCDGCNPTYQLDNLDVIDTLTGTLGSESAAMAAFNDISTQQGFFVLENTVVDGRREKAAKRTRLRMDHPVLPTTDAVDFIRDAKGRMEDIEAHLLDLGAVSADGSWAIVDGSQDGESFGQYGPQDPNLFPTTFYEMFVDTKDASAHFFSEPGMPINQIYGAWGNLTMGRNRGFAYANDYLVEPFSEAVYNGEAIIRVRNTNGDRNGHAVVTMPLFRSKSKGIVMEVAPATDDNSSSMLTLRNPFIDYELRGLNMLTALFTMSKRREVEDLSFQDVLDILFDPSKQSNVIHSHLQIADADNVAAAMNGLFSVLPPIYDRRFPLLWSSETPLPEYEIRNPLLEVNKKVRYYSWNSPFNDEVEYGGNYNYGGLWRQSYMDNFFADVTDLSGRVTFEQISNIPTVLGKGCALQLGGGGQVDRFAEQIWPIWKNLLPNRTEFNEVRALLDGFNGDAWTDVTANDLDDGYVLANSWLFRVIEEIFGPTFSGTRFSIPSIADQAKVPLPRSGPNQRYAALITLLSRGFVGNVDEETSGGLFSDFLHHQWVDSNDAFVRIVLDALDQTLLNLGNFEGRPWGIGQRPNADFNGVGDVFDEPLASVPDGQLPSLNANVRMSRCGPTAVDSSVHFGVSGTIFEGPEGEPVFDKNSMDQLELFKAYDVKHAPRLFRATIECLESQNVH